MKTTKNITFAIALIIVVLTSCKKDVDPGRTAVEKMAGDWYLEDITDRGHYYHFSTYNTAANLSTEMWLTDNGTFWSAKGPVTGKINCDVNSLTFNGTNVSNITPALPITFTIKSGKVILKGTKGPVSKSPTDSIYFEAEFSDDPGTTYRLSGYKRTGFDVDDH